MNKKPAVLILKKLLQTNKHRIKVYKIAFKSTKFNDLKSKFLTYIATSKLYESQLIQVVEKLNGNAKTHNTLRGYLFIFSMKFNMLFYSFGRKRILDFCNYCEDTVKRVYFRSLNYENRGKTSLLNQKIITVQQGQIALEQDEVSTLRDNSI